MTHGPIKHLPLPPSVLSLIPETFDSLVSFTSNLTGTLFDSAYSALAADCRPLVFQLFSSIRQHLSGDSNTPLDQGVRRFYNDLFPLVYRRLLNPGIGHTAAQSFSSQATGHDDCLRMTRQDVNPFGPHPRLLLSSLSRALRVGRALSQLLRLAEEVLNATERATLSRECGRGLVRMQYCSHCRGLTLIRPCTGLCVNIMRGCLVSVMELALLAVRNHVNDAILHAQLHGPRITGISKWTASFCLCFKLLYNIKNKILKEFEGSIQRYQWFFSELPEMLCESEMEVEQHTCWNGQDVVERCVCEACNTAALTQHVVLESESHISGSHSPNLDE
uniref:Glypican 5c n=1 Tax=Mola mola TaxID=94237 RepID=A0A3Q3VNQ4_MOLML